MPRIKPYEIQSSAKSAPAGALMDVNSAGAVGRGIQQIGEAGSRLGDAVYKRQEQEELSQLHADISKTHAAWTVEYQKQLQDGTLNTEEFTKKFNESIDKLQDNVSTRAGNNYFTQASSELKAHFLETAAAGQAQLAGARAVNNFKESLDGGSATLINDPSSFQLTHKMQMDGIDNLVKSGGLPAVKAEELRRAASNSLAKSAVRGWINLNPEAAKEQINSGKWDKYLGEKDQDAGEVKLQLLGQADQAIHAKEIESNRIKQQQKEAREEQQKAIQNDFLKKMEAGKLSTKDVLNSNLDAFGSGSKEQFLKLLEQNNEAKIKTDSGTFIAIWDKIHLPDGDPNKITDENDLNKYMGRGLTLENINSLRAEIQGKKTIAGAEEADLKKTFFDSAKSKLTKSNPLTGIKDPVGDEQYLKFLSTSLTEYNKRRQEGKSPQDLFNPDSPDYLGKNMNQYVRSNKDIIADMVKSNRRGVTPTPTATPEPRKEGESAADYLKRLGK